MNTFVPILDLAIFLLVLALARFILGDPRAEPWVKNLGAAQTVITILAVVLAASWFVVEQPHASKLKMDIQTAAAPGPPGYAMALAEVSFTNLGTSVVNLKGAKLKLFVQQVFPTPPKVAARAGLTDTRGALVIDRAENWGALARTTDTLSSFLESGESENLYYRVALPCDGDMHVYMAARLKRPPMPTDILFGVRDYEFRKQVLLNLGGVCGAALRNGPQS